MGNIVASARKVREVLQQHLFSGAFLGCFKCISNSEKNCSLIERIHCERLTGRGRNCAPRSGSSIYRRLVGDVRRMVIVVSGLGPVVLLTLSGAVT